MSINYRIALARKEAKNKTQIKSVIPLLNSLLISLRVPIPIPLSNMLLFLIDDQGSPLLAEFNAGPHLSLQLFQIERTQSNKYAISSK